MGKGGDAMRIRSMVIGMVAIAVVAAVVWQTASDRLDPDYLQHRAKISKEQAVAIGRSVLPDPGFKRKWIVTHLGLQDKSPWTRPGRVLWGMMFARRRADPGGPRVDGGPMVSMAYEVEVDARTGEVLHASE